MSAKLNRISYSQLSMYNECPLRWKLNYVDKLSISESNIHLIFGTAMHEVLQHYLNVMYAETAKKADEINLDEMLRDNLIEQFKLAEEKDGKSPCTKEELMEFFDDGILIIDFFKKRRGDYFGKRGWELVGCEVPIEVDLKNNIKIVSFGYSKKANIQFLNILKDGENFLLKVLIDKKRFDLNISNNNKNFIMNIL